MYKVFSSQPLAFKHLLLLFSESSSIVATREWSAYPVYTAPERLDLPFRVSPPHRVYTTGVAEGAVSAMEIAAIGGRNVSLLLQKDLLLQNDRKSDK